VFAVVVVVTLQELMQFMLYANLLQCCFLHPLDSGSFYVTLRCMNFSLGFALGRDDFREVCGTSDIFFVKGDARTLLSTGTAQQPAALPRFVVCSHTCLLLSRQESNEPAPVQSGGTNEAELARKTTVVKVIGFSAGRPQEVMSFSMQSTHHPHTQVLVCSGHGQVVRCCDHGTVVVGMATTTVTFIIMVFSIVIFVSSPLCYSCGGCLFQFDVRQ
jgi:hypothetical protein